VFRLVAVALAGIKFEIHRRLGNAFFALKRSFVPRAL